eukprot:scaffold1198_cov116-Isochrysis_galbana.AAC.8
MVEFGTFWSLTMRIVLRNSRWRWAWNDFGSRTAPDAASFDASRATAAAASAACSATAAALTAATAATGSVAASAAAAEAAAAARAALSALVAWITSVLVDAAGGSSLNILRIAFRRVT